MKNKKNIGEKIVLDEKAVYEYCQKQNVQCHFGITYLFIKTPFGAWYIDSYTEKDKKIELYHGNLFTYQHVGRHFRCDYHKQDKSFDDVFSAIDYICRHDFNKLQREAKFSIY